MAGVKAAARSIARRSHILDDEELLAGTKQAELTPRDVLDCRRILTQPPRIVPKPRIVGSGSASTSAVMRATVVTRARPRQMSFRAEV